MNSPRARAFVIGEGNTDVTRPLAMAGIRSVIVASPLSTARFSRFVDKRLPWCDPWSQPDELVGSLIDGARWEEVRPVLIYQGDGNALVVSRFRDALAPHFRFAVPDARLTEQLNDKNLFQSLASELNLPVPRAVIAVPRGSKPSLEPELSFPLVVKPGQRKVDHWSVSGGKAALVKDAQALRDIWPSLSEANSEFIFQEWIEGPESQVLSYHAYVRENGEIAAEFTGEKIRTRPSSFGHSTSVSVVTIDEVVDLSRQLMRSMRFSGIVKLDYKRRPTGELALFEVNTKFNLWHLPGALAGVNIPAIVYEDLVGNRDDRIATATSENVTWVKPWADLPVAVEEGTSAMSWLRWFARVDSVRDLWWRDPGPAFGLVLGLLVRLGRRVLRSLRGR